MIIAFSGHRDKQAPTAAFDSLPKDALWVHGGAIGFDTQVENYARAHRIRTRIIKPDYDRYGKIAPLVRNREIIEDADLLVVCFDGRTRGGTFHTINLAKERDIPIENIYEDTDENLPHSS